MWILRNSWGTTWGTAGYGKIEYGCSRIGYNALVVDYHGVTPTIAFAYPDDRPEMLSPGQPTTFRVSVVADTGTPLADTGQLHYALNGGAYETAPMTVIGTNEYLATLPAADCYDTIDWYVSAEEQTTGRQYDPNDAPWDSYASAVLTGIGTVLADDFERRHRLDRQRQRERRPLVPRHAPSAAATAATRPPTTMAPDSVS